MLTPSLISRWVTGASWQLSFDIDLLDLGPAGAVPYLDIQRVICARGWLWATVSIEHKQGKALVTGFPKAQADTLVAALQALPRFRHALALVAPLFSMQRYVPNRVSRQTLATLESFQRPQPLNLRALKFAHAHMSANNASGMALGLKRLTRLLQGDLSEVAQANETFVAQELEREAEFFASVESTPLTAEQARAAVVFEDRNLLIAAAGSGKSSTVVAKIGYALRNGLVEPTEVLALAFGKKASEEVLERCQDRLGEHLQNGAIHASTFHSLGTGILKAAERQSPRLADWAASETRYVDVVAALIRQLMQDATFKQRFIQFAVLWGRRYDEELAWLWNSEQDSGQTRLEAYEERLDDARMRSEVTEAPKRLPTMQGELVRSEQELAIANWLFMHGIRYAYEKPYIHDTRTHEKRQYLPDFYYPDIDCWHEHFALNDKGQPPIHFGQVYLDGIQWKRQLHAEKGTALIETTSAQFRDGSVFAALEHTLVARGLQPQLRSPDDIERALPGEPANLVRLLAKAVRYFKSNAISMVEVRRRAGQHSMPARALAFLPLLEAVHEAYEQKLNALGCIDFEDMIGRATQLVREGRFVHPYRLILVDEFQDISASRAGLLKALLDQNPQAQLFAVGDDWQSIYRFTGSDLSVMTKFEALFGVTATNQLTQTFRSNQGIATLAAQFVQCNPHQLRKPVRAQNPTLANVVRLLPYFQESELITQVEAVLETLAQSTKPRTKTSVFFLGRYLRLRPQLLDAWQKRHEDQLDLKFMSIHTSKGLQADHVVLLGLSGEDRLGFPSKQEDDSLMQLVMPEIDPYPFAEERRLMYVAMTRARHRVHLCVPARNPSTFVEGLIKLAGQDMLVGASTLEEMRATVCPECGTGNLVERPSKFQGTFIGCSRYPRCDYRASSQKPPRPVPHPPWTFHRPGSPRAGEVQR